MSSQLEKLKSSIKKEYVDKFEYDLMKSSGFIPVDKRQNDFWIILNKRNSADKARIENIIKEKYSDLTPKFIPVESGDFDELFKVIDKPQDTNSTLTGAQQGSNEPSAEEMLVSIGWITKAQLEECKSEEKKKKIPLDGVFREKGYLSYERIVSYLKKKYQNFH